MGDKSEVLVELLPGRWLVGGGRRPPWRHLDIVAQARVDVVVYAQSSDPVIVRMKWPDRIFAEDRSQ